MQTMHAVVMDDLRQFLNRVDPATGKLPQIGGSADKMTYNAGVQWLVICIQFCYLGMPIGLGLDMAVVDTKSAAIREAPGNGYSTWIQILNTVEGCCKQTLMDKLHLNLFSVHYNVLFLSIGATRDRHDCFCRERSSSSYVPI